MPGTLTYSPADVLRQLLVDLGHGTLPSSSSSWPAYCSTLADTPDNIICLIDTTGVHQGRKMVDGEVQERHGVQIFVRSARFIVGWTKARQVAVALDGVLRSAVTVSSTNYLIQAVTRSSGPIALGKETQDIEGSNTISKREIFSINCTVSVRETS